MFTFASCIWVQPWFIWHSFLMSLCYHQLLARLIALPADVMFLLQCAWYFLLINSSVFSQNCLCCSYVSSHIGHFVNWILLERCTAVRCRSLNDFAVSTEVNNWPKRWVFSSDTLRLATWRIGWWWVVSQVFSLVDDFCKKKTSYEIILISHKNDALEFGRGSAFPIYGYVRYFHITLLSLISIEGPVVKF